MFGASSSQLPMRTQDPPRQLNDNVYLLHEPAGDNIHSDIIFFHGLMFESSEPDFHISSWMSRDGSVCWPAQWLSEDFPSSRIYSVLYDGHLVQTCDGGRMDLRLLGESILLNLTTLARVGDVCPVILVGHCVGGLVIKQLCVEASHQIGRPEKNVHLECFLRNLRGVFYFSTPHLGSKSLAEYVINRTNYSTNRLPISSFWMSLLAKFIHKFHSHSVQVGALTDHLQELSTAAARLDEEFNQLRQKYNWRTFAVGASAMQSLVDIFVGEATTRTGSQRCYVDSGANHQTVNKVVSRKSSSYRALMNFINDCVQEPGNKLVSRSSSSFRGSKDITNNHDEESHGHSYQLPFDSDPKYVLLEKFFIRLSATIGSAKCNSLVVNVHGGPGTGKSSIAKYLAQHYTDLARNLDKGKGPEYDTVQPDTYDDGIEGWIPDCVFFIFCGDCSLNNDRDGKLRESDSEIAERLDELIQGLTRSRRRPPHSLQSEFRHLFRDGDPAEVRKDGKSLRVHNRDHLRAILSSPLSGQKVLIILDDVWSKGVFRDFYVPAVSIRYLVTSQIQSVCEDAGLPTPVNIRISAPSTDEASRILFNYIGEISHEQFHGSDTYSQLQTEVRKVIAASERHPFVIVNFALTMRTGSDSCNPRDWQEARKDLLGFLDDKTENEEYSRGGSRTLIRSMLMVLKSLSPEARRLSILAALWDSPHKIPEALLWLFMRHIKRGYYLRCIKELEDRSLIQAVHTGPSLNSNKYYSMHSLRREIILQHRKEDVRHVVTTLGNYIQPLWSGACNYIFSIESSVEACICLIYGGSELQGNVISRYFNEGKKIPWIRSGTDARELAARAPELRRCINPLLVLLNSDCGDRSRPMVERIIIKYVCHRELDDESMSELLRLPHLEAKDAALRVLNVYGNDWFQHLTWGTLDGPCFAENHGHTIHALQEILRDRKATPSTGAILAKEPVLEVLFTVMFGARTEDNLSFRSCLAYIMNSDFSAADGGSCVDVIVSYQHGNHSLVQVDDILQCLIRATDNGEGVGKKSYCYRLVVVLLMLSEGDSDIKDQAWHDACGRVLTKVERVFFPARPELEEDGREAAGPVNFRSWNERRMWRMLDTIYHLSIISRRYPHCAVTPFLVDKVLSEFPHMLNRTQYRFSTSTSCYTLWNLAYALEAVGKSTGILKVPGLREYLEFVLANFPAEAVLAGLLLAKLYPTWVSLILESPELSSGLYLGRALKRIEENRLHDALADVQRGLAPVRERQGSTYVDAKHGILVQSRIYWLKAKMGECGGALEDIGRLITLASHVTRRIFPATSSYFTAALILDRGIIKRLNSDLAGSLADVEECLRRMESEIMYFQGSGLPFSTRPIFIRFPTGRVKYIPALLYDCVKHRGYLRYLLGDKEGAVEDAESAISLVSRYDCKREPEHIIDMFPFLHREPIKYLDFDL